MSASPSHPVAVPVDLQAGPIPKVLNLAEAAAFVRCSRANLRGVIHHDAAYLRIAATCLSRRSA